MLAPLGGQVRLPYGYVGAILGPTSAILGLCGRLQGGEAQVGILITFNYVIFLGQVIEVILELIELIFKKENNCFCFRNKL